MKPTPPARRGRLVLACLLAAAAIAAAVWLFRPAPDRVGEALGLVRESLSGNLGGREADACIDRLIRTVDKLQRDDVKAVNTALREEWSRAWQAGMDAYFAADAADREKLLDRDIERLRVMRELELAVDPRATGRPPRPRRQPSAKAKADDAAKLPGLYRQAIIARAAARRISLPAHLLD